MFELFDPKRRIAYMDVYNDKETAEEAAKRLTEFYGRKILVREVDVDSE